jgi:acid phosphatase family membrane protein YuiD
MESRESTLAYVLVVVVAWFGAHIVKYVIDTFNDKNHGFSARLFMSGGMPSSHSATVVSMATIIGLRQGFGSALFGLALLFALIVMYDAAKVRRSSGEQGLAIQQLIKEQNSKVRLPRAAQGHTPLEVAFGALFGLLVGVIVYLSTN